MFHVVFMLYNSIHWLGCIVFANLYSFASRLGLEISTP